MGRVGCRAGCVVQGGVQGPAPGAAWERPIRCQTRVSEAGKEQLGPAHLFTPHLFYVYDTHRRT